MNLDTPNAICPKCRSLMRQRLMAQVIRTRTDLLTGDQRILHVAPERCIGGMLDGHADVVGIDLHPERFPDAVRGDVTDLAYEDEFDGLICSHVLEHVPDESAAMRELLKALRPGGLALIAVPLDGATTDDRPELSEADRLREYGCLDHVRLNGLDFGDRLAATGFDVEVIRADEVSGDFLDRSVSTPHTRSDDVLFMARKPLALATAD